MKKLYIVLLVLAFSATVHAQNSKDNSQAPAATVSPSTAITNLPTGTLVNYIRELSPLVPVQTENQLNDIRLEFLQCGMTTSYTDAAGRPLQTVTRKYIGSKKDLVQHIVYDEFGRTPITPLPFVKDETDPADAGKFSLDVSDNLTATYTALGYTSDAFLYTQTLYESSPLNRVTETRAQGKSWVGNAKGVLSDVAAYGGSDDIRKWTVAFAQGSLAQSAETYLASELWVKTVTDEDGKQSKTYHDMNGRLVCSQLSGGAYSRTYYVYDDYGALRYNITPRAIEELVSANTWNLTQTIADNLCFRYEYDELGRQVLVKKPGIGETIMMYNSNDELIFTQDAQQRADGKWFFIKYDVAGRPIQKGLFSGTMTYNPGNVNGLLYYMGQTVRSQVDYKPAFNDAQVFITYYYDTYDFTSYTFNTSFQSVDEGYDNTQSNNTYGKLTGKKVLLSDDATELTSIHFYNSRGELIQVQNENPDASWSYVHMGYDFRGLTVKSIFQRSSSFFITKKYVYDSYGRLMFVKHKINNAADYRTIAGYRYDDLGRLESKALGEMKYPVFYEYNIRNWITGINKIYCENKNSGHYFGMKIYYEYGYERKFYNSRIAGAQWRNKGTSDELRSYGYTYDDDQRLSHAKYEYIDDTPPDPNAPSVPEPKDFTASNMTYDVNGNLLTMKHNGYDGMHVTVLDDLVYTYGEGKNQLESVSETNSSTSADPDLHDQMGDFRDVTGSTDYTYDANGNLASDNNRGISNINSNWFNINKPIVIAYGNDDKITYLYDAMGNLLKKTIVQSSGGNTTTTTFSYFGDLICKNNDAFLVMHDEGRVRLHTVDPPSYDYFLKDHIGNVRSIISEDASPAVDVAMDPNNQGGVQLPLNNDGVTDGAPPVVYLATSEVLNNDVENQLFENISVTRDDRPLSTDPGNQEAAKLSPAGGKTLGPGLMLQVMAGDEVQLGAEAFFFSNSPGGASISFQSLAESIIASLFGLGSAGSSEAFFNASQAALVDPNALSMTMNTIQPYGNDPESPYAYLNYILFDDQMNMVEDQSGAIQVTQADAWANLDIPRFTINQNGYLYVFTSNQGPGMSISTDNLHVLHWKGSVMEEMNYYPYGLTFDVAKQSGAMKSDIRYNSQSIEQEEFKDVNDKVYGVDWYDFAARTYDPQIGRWMQADPKMQHSSPYLAMRDNPVSFTDPDGLEDFNVHLPTVVVTAQAPLWKKLGYNSPAMFNSDVETNIWESQFFSRTASYTDFISPRIIDYSSKVVNQMVAARAAQVNAIRMRAAHAQLVTNQRSFLNQLTNTWKKQNLNFYIKFNFNVTAGIQSKDLTIAAVKLYEGTVYRSTNPSPPSDPNYYLGKDGIYHIKWGSFSVKGVGIENNFQTRGYGHIEGTETHELKLEKIILTPDKQASVKFDYSNGFLLMFEGSFEIGVKEE